MGEPMEKTLLNATDLSVQSAGGRLRDLNFSAARGEILLVSSADARRVTALLRVLAGLDSPLAGSLQYFGRGIGLTLSEDELPPWAKIKHELSLYRTLNHMDEARLGHLMESWDLEGIYDLSSDLLSPYELTAFFLVMEMSSSPELLLCQEPLAGLNPNETRRMLKHLRSYAAEGHLVILGSVNETHYPKDLRRISLDKVQTLPQEAQEPAATSFFTAEPQSHSTLSQRKETFLEAREYNTQVQQPDIRPSSEPILRVQPEPSLSPSVTGGQDFGGRKLVTVFIPLPVTEETDYALRRIGVIKYFQRSGNGYEIDLLEQDKNQLSVLLAERGLKLQAYKPEEP